MRFSKDCIRVIYKNHYVRINSKPIESASNNNADGYKDRIKDETETFGSLQC